MVQYEIGGISVRFPYEAYPCQIKYMERVIACLNQGWNGVLESPTGTGKTLCLLCACLAWQQDLKNKRLEAELSQLTGSHRAACLTKNGTPMTKPSQCITYPKILYTSRTHMQLSQVVRELNKTAYKSVKMCLMGSRDQLCIHEEVRNEENSTLKNHMCRAKVKTRTCHFYNGFDAYQNGAKPQEMREKDVTNTTEPTPTALDIEDFISFGRRNKICPFFMSRDKPEEADLLLMPYNYVVDIKARKANKIDLNNVILIFDEAHNLEKICEESASFTFTSRDIAGSTREAREALKAVMTENEALRREMDEAKMAFGTTASEDVPSANIDEKELGELILLLDRLENELNKIDIKSADISKPSNSNSLPGMTFPGAFFLELLQQAEIHVWMRDPISNLIDKVTSYLTEKATNTIWETRGAALQRFASLLNTVYSADNNLEDMSNEIDMYRNQSGHFKVYVSAVEEEKRSSAMVNNLVKSIRRNQSLQLNYWCFNAGLTMQSLAQKGVYSMLVTSGTLSPLSHFQAEMKIPFQIALENDHVIKADQAWFGVICQGPDGCQLDSSYGNRQNGTYILSLGNTLVNIFRLVPEGCLVFFASYAQMTSCIEQWQAAGIWDRISKHKTLYVEPKSKDEFYRVIGEYNNIVKTRPAAFFAVCRGKVSEGIDFADSAARAVIIVGIPYPPMYDPRVVLKKEFLSGQQRSKLSQASSSGSVAMSQRSQSSSSLQASSVMSSNAVLDGDTWYRTEAIRAINQSIGRVIRHKDDYGAVILADRRFSSWNRDRFPSWIIPNYCSYQKFGEFSKSLAQFFKDKKPKQEEPFTALKPKETGFEKNATLRMREFEGKRQDELTNPKKPKCDFGKVSISFDHIRSSKSNGGVIPTVAGSVEQTYGTMWEALEKGSYRADTEETYAPYRPSTSNASMPIEPTKRRQKIVIKKQSDNGARADVRGDVSKTGQAEKNEAHAENLRRSAEYIRMAKTILGRDRFGEFRDLVKAYKSDYRFEPVFSFLKSLPFAENVDVLKGFTIFLHEQHQRLYRLYMEEEEKRLVTL